MALLMYHRERMGGWGGAVASLGTLNNKDLLLLLGSEPWTVQPIAWSLFGLQLRHPLNPALQQFAFCIAIYIIVSLRP
jgi:hypothetical protein